MLILTSNRAEAKEKNNEQSFSAREMGKNVKTTDNMQCWQRNRGTVGRNTNWDSLFGGHFGHS